MNLLLPKEIHIMDNANALIEASEEDLKTLIFFNLNVLVEYYDTDCEHCDIVDEIFNECASDKEYADIMFVKINAKENSIARKAINNTGIPLFVCYKNGLLLESISVKTKAGIKKMLAKLKT